MKLTLKKHKEYEEQGRFLRVFHKGVDITSRCFYADDEKQFAEVFKLDERGRKFIDGDTGEPAVELLEGNIVIQSDVR